MIPFHTLLADGPLPDPKTLHSPSHAYTDPTIDYGGQAVVYIGLALLVLLVTVTVGFFSRRLEHALMTALGLSLCVVALFVFTK